MTIDELKKCWDNLDARQAASEECIERIERRIVSQKVDTVSTRIIRRAHIMAAVCLCPIPMFIPFWTMSHGFVIYAITFFIIASAFQLLVANAVKAIDCCSMTMAEALRQTIHAEQMRNRFRIAGMAIGLPLIVWLLTMSENLGGPIIFYSALAGMVIGGSIGLIINHRFVVDFRQMKSELDNIE